MKKPFQYTPKTLRVHSVDATAFAAKRFPTGPELTDAQYLDSRRQQVIAWAGLTPRRPIVRTALADAEVAGFLRTAAGIDADLLVVSHESSVVVKRFVQGRPEALSVPDPICAKLAALAADSAGWAGHLADQGDYVCDPRTPAPGTHFRANLLLGDRAGFSNPLLTTPKALVDEWGRGSSRSHADKQILATRWDLLPEENGFPANRQFYLVENGRQILYSAAPEPEVVVQTRHSVNHTIISYRMPDGLEIERTLFIVPAEDGLPLGVEAQLVRFRNNGRVARKIDLVMTGMFGYIHPGALTVDVIYTCVTVEPGLLEDAGAAGPVIVAPRYTAGWGVDDRPFNLTQVFGRDGKGASPTGFCLDYRKFVGNGSLERPQNVANPDNAFPKKGPAFFALTLPVDLDAGGEAECHSFNGLVSRHEGEPVTDEVLCRRLGEMAAKAVNPSWARAGLARVRSYQDAYRSAVQIRTPCRDVDCLVNVHLPFQIRYQTYVSRSFALTQKGFRQIGFREIQDLFGALPFEVASGRKDHIRDLIGVWAGHVHRFGYADHQFYWNGVEPGRYSDDALWLFQAVGRFIDLTGDASILDIEWPVAGENGRRSLYETLRAALRYSGRISVGKHGLPLIDHADWNDTLNLDGEGIHGPEKEVLYRKQIAEGLIRDGEPIQTDLSESIMNGFLLEIARAYFVRFAAMKGDRAAESEWTEFGATLATRLQATWKNDFFARAYLNRPNAAGATYLGAGGDGLSADPNVPGTYFLNSFSWPILSGIATDEQIATMLDRVENILLTPVGIRLSSPTRFDVLMGRSGSGDYAYGDRENGGVFKHAAMMATSACVEAARRVADRSLAERLLSLAWKVLLVTAPFHAGSDPYRLAGNLRFCTQYVNPATGEHIGPLVSGTAPWMWLSYLAIMGIEFRNGEVLVDPVLPLEWTSAAVDLNVPSGRYHIEIAKPTGFARAKDGRVEIRADGAPSGAQLPRSPGRDMKVSIRLG